MSKIAQRMAEQDFGWYCPDERDDEIGTLAKSLNTLSDELSGALTKLNDKNLYLKNEITLEKEKERRRMLFFSGVSHELKTPISVVIGQIEGMQKGIGVYKDRDRYLEKCRITLRELLDFINEILLVVQGGAQVRPHRIQGSNGLLSRNHRPEQDPQARYPYGCPASGSFQAQ